MTWLATWLLRTFGSGPSVEMLIGDLTEEYHRGRSVWWLCAQLVVAIPVTFLHEVRSHQVLIVRAVAVAGMLGFLWRAGSRVLLPWITAAINLWVPEGEPYPSSRL